MKIDFCLLTPLGNFCDCLHLPDDHQLTEEQIEQMKQARLDAWYDFINNPQQTAGDE